MKSGSTQQFRVALAILATLVLAVPAMATTYMMATDQSMVEASSAVVEARILSRDHAPGVTMPSTDYMIEVSDVLSGEVTGRNLIVRVPGGERPDGIGLYLSGMPEFVVGERVLLFLDPRPDGAYGVRHLMLGAFHEVARAGQSVYVRGLQGAQEMVIPGLGDSSPYYRLRSAEPFRRWVEAVGGGDLPESDYFVEPEAGLGRDGDLGRVTGQFRLFTGTGNGLNILWFDFDSGGSVDWRNRTGGQPGFSANATANAFRSGMAAWNNDNGSNVDYRYVGTTGANSGFSRVDGINALIYANVDESIDDGDFTCTSTGGSGVLALGGPFFCTPGSSINSPPAYRNVPCPAGPNAGVNAAFEAEIITNRGIECLFQLIRNQPDGNQRAQRALEALLGHELGHTLGIGHSCTDAQVDAGTCPAVLADALMYPFLHTDGRGAVLNSDDRKAIRFLYPGSSAPEVPAAPSNLVAELTDATSILLTWQDNSNDESSFVVETSIAGAGFETIATMEANTETVELTDLEDETTYRFRVKARNGQGSSVPSNEVALATELGLPDTPGGLVVETGSATSVVMTWEDLSDNETDFVVEALNVDSDGEWFEVQSGVTADPDSGTVDTTVDGLTTGLPHSFRVRARNGAGMSGPSNVDAATPDENPDGCVEDATTLCLLDGRFQVSTVWRDFRFDRTGVGRTADGLGDRTGTFWFFREDNVELIVKVLDGTGINEFYWTFYGALSDVEYWVTVVDTEDGDSRTYYNAPGEQCGRLDTASIPVDLPIDPGASSQLAAVPQPLVINGEAETGTCEESDTTLCLLDDRFAVEVDWVVSDTNFGEGTAVKAEASQRTGYFWFFKKDNIELVVKALDGRVVNGYFWFFYGALSDVEYEITVTDTVEGRTRTYRNEAGNQCGQFDNTAFLPEDDE